LPEVLVEVGCEELPSSACREILEQAPALAASALEALRLGADETRVWVAPRRFALHLSGVPERQEASSRSVRGPAEAAAFGSDGAPTKAAEGFARGQGVAVADLVVREDNGRRFVFAERAEDAQEVADLVPELTRRLVEGLRFSKTMRWGSGDGLRFSRPVRWLVAKVDERTVPFELHGLEAGEVSQGHRFLGGPAAVTSAGAYRDVLRGAAVVADHEERRAEIRRGLETAAAALDAGWSDPAGKLEEVVFLVERPSVITGRIDEAHLRLPSRVLVTAMQSHQRYFPLEDRDGLRPAFLAVSNGDPAHAATIARGNEEVLDARLQDAAFSYDRDREAGLGALDARLDTIVFHQRLGTMADKRDRLVPLVEILARAVGVDHHEPTVAARLAKVDQGAILVAEFSDLEGYVAAQYARLEGHGETVATAIEEQYLPLGPDSPLPSTAAGALVAVADKVDNLVGAFAVDELPSGSKDPYGLRRAASGLVRILIDRGWDVDPLDLVGAAYGRLVAQGADLALPVEAVADALAEFIADRLVFQLGAEGVGAEAVRAAIGAGLGSLPATAAWARAIDAARETAEWERAWTACTRCAKLAAKSPESRGAWRPAGDPGEDALGEAIAAARPRIESAVAARDFGRALGAAADLAPAIDRFFEDVLVNAEDPEARARRYGLLWEATSALTRVADFTRVTQGGAR
jgi:glycyl-tRNA synthetase beta chain